MSEVTWKCPNCNTDNVDLRDETTQPMCEYCDQTFDWHELDLQGGFRGTE